MTFFFSDMPKEYIYEPWTAPLSVQKKARCIIGKDYPKPGKLFVDSFLLLLLDFCFPAVLNSFQNQTQ